jgi:beta-xylosidase
MYRLALTLSVIAGLIKGAVQAPVSSLAQRDSPVLDGYNADPNIAVFGDTYYIYPTSDGLDWEGKDFYVWKSKNLVDWTRGEKPILTLNGANGNVPWSDGKAVSDPFAHTRVCEGSAV